MEQFENGNTCKSHFMRSDPFLRSLFLDPVANTLYMYMHVLQMFYAQKHSKGAELVVIFSGWEVVVTLLGVLCIKDISTL